MSLRDFLRRKICGSSLVIPNTNEFWKIFRFEATNRFTFLLYLLFILILIAFSVWLCIRNTRKSYLLLTIGLSFVFCAFILQKMTSFNLENRENRNLLLRNELKKDSWLISRFKKFISQTSNFYKRAEHLVGFEKKSFLESNINIRHHKKKHRKVHKTTRNAGLVDGKAVCVTTKENSTNINDPECDDQNDRVQKRDKSEKYLTRLHEVFIDHKKNSIEQIQFINRLAQLEIKVKENLSQFKTSFDNFLSKGKEIESEMLGFNAPIRFLNTEYENLSNEIEKYFSLIKNFENEKPSLVPITYLENILKTRKIFDETNENNIIDTKNLLEHNRYIKMLVIILIVILIVVFVIMILEISFMMIFIIPIISLICSLLLVASIVILLDAQILDRNCKTGTVKDCNFDIMQADEYMKDIRRTEFVNQSEIFKNDIEQVQSASEKRTKAFQDYTNLLMKDRLREEIGVFLNLFDKIVFVNENFDSLTENKIDSDAFYVDINKMIKILEKFKDMFTQDIKEEALKMLMNEYKFCYFIKQEKDEIVSRTKSIMLGSPHKKSNLKIKNCISILEDLCRSRDRLDVVFNSIMIFVPLVLISLFL